MRVLVGSDTVIYSPTFVGADEDTPTDADDMPTATATDLAGDESTLVVVERNVSGQYQATIPAVDDLDQIEVVWSATVGGLVRRHTQTVLVVDAHYASLPELRAHPDLADSSRVAATDLMGARDEFAELVEQYRGASWVGRVTTETLTCGPHRIRHLFPRSILTFDLDGTPVETLGDWSIDGLGLLAGGYLPYRGAVRITYSYGLADIPRALHEACLEYVREVTLSVESGIPRNALSWGDGQGGTYRTSTADLSAGRPTGFREVDRLLNSVPDHRIPGIA